MDDSLHIKDFLEPLDLALISGDHGFRNGQIGRAVQLYEDSLPDLTNADIIIIGCDEERGNNLVNERTNAPDLIRQQLYQLYYWHDDVRIADIGNVRIGAALRDSYAALKTVISAIHSVGKKVLILGGGHDLTLAQYHAYSSSGKIIEATSVDALIDIDMDSLFRAKNFLMEILTGEPNFIRHYNHIGFQSFFVHPHMLETMDKLHFDCFRLGHVKERIEEMEPVIRNSNLVSFDISAISSGYAPASRLPNGFNGEEACTLMRFAGMSNVNNSMGIYGYDPTLDQNAMTAMQISQMIWYFIDGVNKGKKESSLEDKDAFNEYHMAFSDVDTTFLQSKKTGRWWMQLPDKKFIACSKSDYELASQNEIPERWFRSQERS